MDPMTMQRFAQLADAWGGDITRWPGAEQAAAARVLASAEGDVARTLLAEAGQLDEALRSVAPAPPSARLRETILAAIPSDPPLPAGAHGAGDGDPAVLGYETRWFPRPVEGDARAAGLPASAGARRGRSVRPAARASAGGGTARFGGIGRMWRELGGTRVAGPALAAALVVGVALGAVRSPGWLESGSSPAGSRDGVAVAAGGDDLLDAALLDAGYEEYLL